MTSVTVACDSHHPALTVSANFSLHPLLDSVAQSRMPNITVSCLTGAPHSQSSQPECAHFISEIFSSMAYLITDSRIKDSLCVDVCPTDCIHSKQDEPGFKTATQMYVDPEVCIGCYA